MNSVVVYPGTFDPITLGHYDMIERASSLFDKVIVAVALTRRKNCFFTIEERVNLARATVQSLPQVEVLPLDGLLVNFARDHGARIILRGWRIRSDLDDESQLAYMNQQLSPEVETLFLLARHQYAYISSSLVREIIELQQDIAPFVPAAVTDYLKRKK